MSIKVIRSGCTCFGKRFAKLNCHFPTLTAFYYITTEDEYEFNMYCEFELSSQSRQDERHPDTACTVVPNSDLLANHPFIYQLPHYTVLEF